MLVTVDELTGRAVKVAGDPAHPVTRGFLCGKVARYLDRVYAPDRLLYPMRRRRGVAKGPLPPGREAEAFERISWDQALDLIAEKLTAIAAEHGPESILPYSYAGTTGQLGYGSMDRRFFHRLGASQLDRTICASAGTAALTGVYGTRLGPRPQDFAHAGLILAWGANVHGCNVHLWPFIEQARRAGARLVVIDPYRTRTAALADEHLQIRPGTDGMLALAIMHVLFRDGLDDAAYLAECTHGAADLRAFALRAEHAPRAAAQITGLAEDAIERLARAYGEAGRSGRKPAVIRMNYGIQRAENGGTAARAVAMLPLITGSWRKRGGGVLLSMSGAFSFDTRRLQMPELMYASPLGRAARTVNMNQLGHALTALGTQPTDNTAEFAPACVEGPPVKAVFVYNCNAAAVAPDAAVVRRGLLREDLFTVVHEQFFTDTTDYADLVLPATTFLEHRELMGSYGHTVAQISEQAIAPLGEARTNTWLFAELARRMGFAGAAFTDDDDALIAQALTGADAWLGEGGTQRLMNDLAAELPLGSSDEALPFSDASWFRTPSGRAELLPLPAYVPASESAEAACAFPGPLQFLPRKADNFMNTTFANLPGHRQMERRTRGVLEMHLADAAARGIAHGDAVVLSNGRGAVHLYAHLGDSVPPGTVAARLDWQKLSVGGVNVNHLTSQRLTDIGGGATFYSTLVEVRRAEPPVSAPLSPAAD